MTNTKITLKYLFIIIVAVLFTWVLHEFMHWLTYQSLGYDALMTLNRVSPTNTPTTTHALIAAAAGPLITIIQAVIVYAFLKYKNWNIYLYPFLLTAFYMRFLAGLINFINPNDEGKISEYLGIGLFTLSIIVSGFLFYLVYNISKQYKLSFKFQIVTIISIMIVSSCIILLDQSYKLRIL